MKCGSPPGRITVWKSRNEKQQKCKTNREGSLSWKNTNQQEGTNNCTGLQEYTESPERTQLLVIALPREQQQEHTRSTWPALYTIGVFGRAGQCWKWWREKPEPTNDGSHVQAAGAGSTKRPSMQGAESLDFIKAPRRIIPLLNGLPLSPRKHATNNDKPPAD